MPVSGNEETGLKPISRQSSDYISGVPMKKRRFPLFCSPSPPLAPTLIPAVSLKKEQSDSLSEEHSDSVQKEQSEYIAGVPIKKRKFPLFCSPAPPLEPTLIPALPLNKEQSDSLSEEHSGLLQKEQSNSPSKEHSDLLRKEQSDSPSKEHTDLLQRELSDSPSKEHSDLLHKEQSDLLQKEQSNLLQKVHSSPPQGSAMSNASVATSSSGISDVNKKPISEASKGNIDVFNVALAQSNPKCSRVELEKASIRIHPDSLDNMGSENKLMVAEKSACPITVGKVNLQLAPNEALALNMGKEVHSKENFEGKCKAEIPTVAGNTELRLGVKEHFFPALAVQNSDGRGQNQGTSEPGSLNLSLSKGSSSSQCSKNGVELNNGLQQSANRANWDLNTTMDAWERFASDAASGQASTDGFNATDRVHDRKPLICTNEMIGITASSEQRSHVESENRANLTLSSSLAGRQNKVVHSLQLGLSQSSLRSQVSQEPSSLSAKEISGRLVSSMGLPESMASTGNLSTVSHRTVKSEPFDDSTKLDNLGTEAKNMGLLNTSRALEHEIVDGSLTKSSNISTLEVAGPAAIKTEPVREGSRQALDTVKGTSQVGTSQIGKQVSQGLSNNSFAVAMPAQMSFPAVEPSCSTGLTIASDVTNHLEHSDFTEGSHLDGEVLPQEACESAMLVASETVAISVCHNDKESSTSVMIANVRAEDGNADDPEQCRLKHMNDHLPDMRGSEDSVSDEEKINISADILEEDSYSSDYESDGNHRLARVLDTEKDCEEDDYEDGEVREPLVHNAVEEPICEKEVIEPVDHGETDDRKMDIVGQYGDCDPTSSHDGDGLKRPTRDIQRNPFDQSDSKDCLKEQETELSSEQTTKGNQEAVATVTQELEEDVKKIDLLANTDTRLPNMEASANGDDAAKDANGGGNRSRIINLSRASHASSPGKTGPISARSLPTQAGSERLPDVALEGEKLHPRGRDESYIDGSGKFSRERHQDLSPRNSRLNFGRGRGRIPSRLDALHGDWDSDRDFTSEFYNVPTEFHVSRHKYASAVANADLEYNSYNIPPDGAFFCTGRGGRKRLNEERAIFRHIPSRRRSPGGRDNPAARGGGQMIRRVPRNVSPGRCVDKDSSEVVGLRHSEKLIRVFHDDAMEPMFTRSQPAYEHFARGARNFSSVQRRGLPRLHSKSPIRSRSRSPVPWSSPRRRSQDGFDGHPELTHRRSPIYRMERVRSPDHPSYQKRKKKRSPDHPCFPADVMARRHGSPPYLSRTSNDLRDLDSGRDHGHPRSVIPNRSQSGRILLRNRRFDVMDPRERTDSDEYFGGVMNTGRLHELGGDANGDERRRFGERRGPARSFRPPYSDADGEGLHLNSDDGPRPFRFCPEDELEFRQRGNLRDREFDRRIKYRPGNAPRRTRSIEEQEANYRRGGGQVWHDDGFDEISRVKRKRF
ncbi:hypothetical protein I3760_02G178200 [Carya illinoinensis]|nr:hypothetical protein I3760_02G178200 [Carya illinoinensis]KAG2723617.1 hypothetical protein I3760_02G178200 [Carya illinoinensis]KAG2723625.1 hypothetical protein I3760_02G178200 [Carya illinoinensis]